ncbi:MAG: glucuronate isomerase, partial [Ruminiclostridium sp.]|nr:glucuronate isomerase [Ruminiclostridium sp.]
MIREINENDLDGLMKLYMQLHGNPFPEMTADVMRKWRKGAAWWFNNNKAGIESQLRTLASISVLGNTIGAP